MQPLVAAQAGESLSVATGAPKLLALARVRIKKIGRVERRLQCLIVPMTRFATERRIDLVVAHQAIGHLRKVRLLRNRSGSLYAAMARRARIGRVQMGSPLGPVTKIRLALNRRGNQRRNVSKLRVKRMIELHQSHRPRLFDDRFMTGEARFFRRQQIVFQLVAAGSLGMTGDTLRFQLRVQCMREIRRVRRGCKTEKRNQPL